MEALFDRLRRSVVGVAFVASLLFTPFAAVAQTGDAARAVPAGSSPDARTPSGKRSAHPDVAELQGRFALLRAGVVPGGTAAIDGTAAASDAAHRMRMKYIARQLATLDAQVANGLPPAADVVAELRHALGRMEQVRRSSQPLALDRLRALEGAPAKAAGDRVQGVVRADNANLDVLGNVRVQLLDRNGRLVAQTVTDMFGAYTLDVAANTALSCDYHVGPPTSLPSLGTASSEIAIAGEAGGKLIDVGVQVAIQYDFWWYPGSTLSLRRHAPSVQQIAFATLGGYPLPWRFDAFFHDNGIHPAYLFWSDWETEGLILQPNTTPLRNLAPNWNVPSGSNNGISAVGTWELEIEDTGGTGGFLEAWNLYLCQGFEAQQPYYLKTDSPDDLPGGPYVDEAYGGVPCEPDCSLATAETLSGGSLFTAKNFALSPGGRISGRVLQAGTTPALPLDGVDIVVYDADGDVVRDTVTNAIGEWSVGGLPAGQFYVLATADDIAGNGNYLDRVHASLACEFGCDPTTGTAITLDAGQTREQVDIRLAVGSFITGRVTDEVSGLPIQFAEVTVYDRFGAVLERVPATGADGVYRTRYGYPPGQYRAATTAVPHPYENELFDNLQCAFVGCTDVHLGTPVVIAASLAPATADFALSSVNGRGAISGQVRDRDDQAIANVVVEVLEFDGATLRDSRVTDSSGNFTVGNLPAGRYFVRTNGAYPPGTVSAHLDILYAGDTVAGIPCPYVDAQPRCPSVGGTPVVVDPPNTRNIILVLDDAGSISGVVTQDGGTGFSDVEVRVMSSAGVEVNRSRTSWSSGTEGRYTVGGLLPGSYYVVTRNGYGRIDEIYRSGGAGAPCAGSGDFDCGFAAATRVQVAPAAQVTGVHFDLDAGGYLSGTVTDQNTSAPLAFIEIEIYDTGGRLITSTFTDMAGQYSTLTCPWGCGLGYREGTGLAGAQYRLFAREHEQTAFRRKTYVDEVFHNSERIYCPSLVSTFGNRTPPACAVSAGSTRLVQPPGGVSGVDFALRRGGIVKGRLTSDVNASDDSRDPANPTVVWDPARMSYSDVEVLDASGRIVGRTRGVSEYEVGGLPEGRQFRVRAVSDFGRGEAWRAAGNVACANLRCATSTGDLFGVFWGLTPPESDFRNFDFDRGGRLSGNVTRTRDGLALAGATVTLYRADGTAESTAITDASGNYVFRGISAGEKHVVATRVGYSDQIFPRLDCDGSCDVRSGSAFLVRADASLTNESNVNFVLRLTPIILRDDFEG